MVYDCSVCSLCFTLFSRKTSAECMRAATMGCILNHKHKYHWLILATVMANINAVRQMIVWLAEYFVKLSQHLELLLDIPHHPWATFPIVCICFFPLPFPSWSTVYVHNMQNIYASLCVVIAGVLSHSFLCVCECVCVCDVAPNIHITNLQPKLSENTQTHISFPLFSHKSAHCWESEWQHYMHSVQTTDKDFN